MATVEPSARAKAAAWRRRLKIGGVIVAILVFCVFVVTSPNGFAVLYLLALGFAMLKKLFNNDAPSEFTEAARTAEANLRNLQYAWQDEASGEEFNAKLDELRTLTDEYRKLPERRKQKVRELERALFERQLLHYLEKFDIASADIPHIKDGRKVMLSSYGIDSAADVTTAALKSVPGFGSFLIMELITWRQSLEAKFEFDPGRGVDPLDIRRVDHDIGKRRAEIELLLSKGPGELKELRRRIIAARDRLRDQLEKAYKDLAQAQADESAAV